jgi:hypothetical protein
MAESQSQEKQYHQYFSTRPVINITMPSSKKIRFVAGVYVTDNADEVKFLDEQIAFGHSMIYVKEGQEVVGEEALDPLAAVKKKAIEEYLATQQKQQDPARDMGNTQASGVSADVATTKTIAAISVGSKSK